MILILDCDHDRGEDNTALDIKAIIGEESSVDIYKVCEGDFPENLDNYSGSIITGSSSNIYDPKPWIREVSRITDRLLNRETPILGVCFGYQLLGIKLGGRLRKQYPRVFSLKRTELTPNGREDLLFDGIDDNFYVLESYGNDLIEIPSSAYPLTYNGDTYSSYKAGNIYGLRFHAEVHGDELLRLAANRGIDPEDFKQYMHLDDPSIGQIYRNFARLSSKLKECRGFSNRF